MTKSDYFQIATPNPRSRFRSDENRVVAKSLPKSTDTIQNVSNAQKTGVYKYRQRKLTSTDY